MDAERTPVIAAVGQSIERSEIVSAVELAARASEAALDTASGLRERIQRLSVISIVFSPASARPASELAERLGMPGVDVDVSTAGGNAPQWMITRAAQEISAGRLDATLIAGAEATRSMRAAEPGASFMRGLPSQDDANGPPDPVVGPPLDNMTCNAEKAIRLFLPTEIYPLFESARAHKAGRSFAEQRAYLGPLMSSFSHVAADHPFAWFRKALSPAEVATASADNRLIAEPYPKQMNAFPNVDQGAAVIVTSLARARELGLDDGCLYIWSGANLAEPPATSRPDLSDAPAMRAAAAAALDSAGVGPDDLALIDLYSCFPVAVEIAAEGIGVPLDDARRLTVTGGLPFFGGPGNNYSMHAIATLAERLPEVGGLGYIGANGGVLSKHSAGVYGTSPPPRGFVAADTGEQQAAINAAALPMTTDAQGPATVAAATVVYDRNGQITDAPVIATLADGRRVAARAHESIRSSLSATNLTGAAIHLTPSPPTYTLPEGGGA